MCYLRSSLIFLLTVTLYGFITVLHMYSFVYQVFSDLRYKYAQGTVPGTRNLTMKETGPLFKRTLNLFEIHT